MHVLITTSAFINTDFTQNSSIAWNFFFLFPKFLWSWERSSSSTSPEVAAVKSNTADSILKKTNIENKELSESYKMWRCKERITNEGLWQRACDAAYLSWFWMYDIWRFLNTYLTLTRNVMYLIIVGNYSKDTSVCWMNCRCYHGKRWNLSTHRRDRRSHLHIQWLSLCLIVTPLMNTE